MRQSIQLRLPGMLQCRNRSVLFRGKFWIWIQSHSLPRFRHFKVLCKFCPIRAIVIPGYKRTVSLREYKALYLFTVAWKLKFICSRLERLFFSQSALTSMICNPVFHMLGWKKSFSCEGGYTLTAIDASICKIVFSISSLVLQFIKHWGSAILKKMSLTAQLSCISESYILLLYIMTKFLQLSWKAIAAFLWEFFKQWRKPPSPTSTFFLLS